VNSGPERLDQDEVELAAQLRQLPHPAPSAALDRQILEAARSALQRPPRRRPSWHWGSAAAAALALLVVAPQWWQKQGDMTQFSEPDHEQPAPRPTLPELGERAKEALHAPPAEPRADSFPTAAPAPPPAPAAPAAPPLPAAPPAPAAATEPAAAAPPAATDSAGFAADADQAAPARREQRSQSELGASRPLRDAAAPSLHKQTAGQQGLAVRVDDELLRIQRLREAGDLQAARAALRQLLATHPQLELPPALRGLLEEPLR
jgi:hypothetical protein